MKTQITKLKAAQAERTARSRGLAQRIVSEEDYDSLKSEVLGFPHPNALVIAGLQEAFLRIERIANSQELTESSEEDPDGFDPED